MKTFIVRFLICFVVLSLICFAPVLLFGGVCVQRSAQPVYSYSHHYAQPVLLKQVYPPYYYSVGHDLQLDAIAEKLSQRIEQKLLQKQKASEPKSILTTSCARCHTAGSKAVTEESAPVYFDVNGKLTANAEQRASMKTAAHLGVMPPSKELTDDEYLELKRELATPNPERPGDP